MADEFDRASERENEEREYRIAEARRVIAIIPDLGCADCKGITHEIAKAKCCDFRVCLSDWQRAERMKTIVGKQDADD